MTKLSPWRLRLQQIIFEADTTAGKVFDVLLIMAITISVLVVMLESVQSLRINYGQLFLIVEWFFTILFTIEYLCRLLSVLNKKKYVFSFFGIIDFLAILPTYLSLVFVGAQSLLVVRSFRLLRIFRIFKLTPNLKQANVLSTALWASGPKITVFLVGVMATVISVGACMYFIEGEKNGFTSIPKSVYWSIVTMTTVGFGGITPKTPGGQMLASALMILGYGILAVPTGIVSVEPAKASKEESQPLCCEVCDQLGHDLNAKFCKYCGAQLPLESNDQKSE